MRKTLFLAILFAVGFVTPACTEELVSGQIQSIDAMNGNIDISDGKQVKRISVSDFIKDQGSMKLDNLDVGLNFTSTVRKNPDGTFVLMAVEKPAEVDPPEVTGDAKDGWLQLNGESPKHNIVDRGLSRIKHLKDLSND